ncbi:hypothetical protein VPH35_080409 [Triticum aestivum]
MAGAMDKFDQMVGIPIERRSLAEPNESFLVCTVLIHIHCTKHQYLDIAKVMKGEGKLHYVSVELKILWLNLSIASSILPFNGGCCCPTVGRMACAMDSFNLMLVTYPRPSMGRLDVAVDQFHWMIHVIRLLLDTDPLSYLIHGSCTHADSN